MIEFTAWEGLNMLCRLGVALIVIVKLTWFYDEYRRDERFGLGVAGGCALMTAPVLVEGPGSPFAEWAGALFAIGVLVYFGGRLRRQFRHAQANQQQHRIAEKHAGARRKAK